MSAEDKVVEEGEDMDAEEAFEEAAEEPAAEEEADAVASQAEDGEDPAEGGEENGEAEDFAEEGAEDAAGGDADGAAGEEGPEQDMIEPSYDKKYVVRQRQRLKTDALADRFVNQLLDAIERERSAGEVLTFEDFDISENKLSPDKLEGIFSALADGGVHVQRFRAFGCPTLDDQAATLLGGWLAGVTTETVPYEMHLSDCAITVDGFNDLMKALEENDTIPAPDPKHPGKGKLPLYLRLEHNYIDESAIQASIKNGIAMKMRKGDFTKYSDSLKVRLLVREDGSFQQKKGNPPAPEDVPDPRPIRQKGKGKGKDKSGKGSSSKGSSWSRDRDSWSSRFSSKSGGKGTSSKGKSSGRDRDSRPPWQALPAPPRVPTSGRDRDRDSRRPGEGRPHRSPARRSPLRRSPVPSSKGRGKDKGSERERSSWGSGSRFEKSDSYKSGGGKEYSSDKGRGENYSSRPTPAGSGSAPYNAFGKASSGNNSSNDRDRAASRPPLKRSRSWDRDSEAAKRPRSTYESSSIPSRGAAGGGGVARERERFPSERFSSSARPTTSGGKGKGGKDGGKGGKEGGSSRPRDGARLPFPWEEHWSAEYKLHYFWNSKTGESSWERPRAAKGAGKK